MPFITFEGIDGSGKSTQAHRLTDLLKALGKVVILTREPWGGRLGKAVRAMLTDPELGPMLSPLEEMLLISASRYDHVQSVIKPALRENCWVICDRFIDATYAYQVFDLLDESLAANISREVCAGVVPDVTFILDVEEDLAKSRLQARGNSTAPDPAEASRNFARIKEGFQVAAERHPQRCHVIDGNQPEAAITAAVSERLREMALLSDSRSN